MNRARLALALLALLVAAYAGLAAAILLAPSGGAAFCSPQGRPPCVAPR